MKKIAISLITVSFGFCTTAFSAQFKEPEFSEDYKVESYVKTDRTIASEKDSEREPSSVKPAEPKKENEELFDETVEPKPWMYKNKLESEILE